MKVKLIADVFEHDKDGNVAGLKTTIHKGHPTIAWVKGTVIDMPDNQAQKFIERGQAEPCTEGEGDASDSQ